MSYNKIGGSSLKSENEYSKKRASQKKDGGKLQGPVETADPEPGGKGVDPYAKKKKKGGISSTTEDPYTGKNPDNKKRTKRFDGKTKRNKTPQENNPETTGSGTFEQRLPEPPQKRPERLKREPKKKRDDTTEGPIGYKGEMR
jgi:hypothetical protein